MKYYGVLRNHRGTEERRYIYTAERILLLENAKRVLAGMEPVTIEDIDGYSGSFYANDTYYIQALRNEGAVIDFLHSATEGACDYEDPLVKDLRYTWSYLDYNCIYTGKENPLVKELLQKYPGDINFRDPRWQKIEDLLLPEWKLSIMENNDLRLSEVLDAAEKRELDQLLGVGKKPVRIIERSFQTVDDLIKILVKLPRSYSITPFGEGNCMIAVDDNNGVVYMDTEKFIREFTEEEEEK